MDAHLRRYLEGPTPRPPLFHAPHDDRRQLWLFPLGAAITFALILGNVFWDRRDSWPTAVFIWLILVFLAALLGRNLHALTQSLFRTGTFTNAHVLSADVKLESEDQTLVVLFRAELKEAGGTYRDAGERDLVFRATLTDRWIVQPTLVPFLRDATFPILVSTDRKQAKIFVNDEEIDAVAAR